jgi:microcystin-dependent protein
VTDFAPRCAAQVPPRGARQDQESAMKLPKILIATALLAGTAIAASPAAAQQRLVGQILMIAGSKCPDNTMEANGQLLAISQFLTLYQLYGTTYGGDGHTTFALPDLRGRAAIGIGQGTNLPDYVLGQPAGVAQLQLGSEQLAPHDHAVAAMATDATSDTGDPAGASLAVTLAPIYNRSDPLAATMATGSIATATTGGGKPFNIESPYLAMRYCVVYAGIVPARS